MTKPKHKIVTLSEVDGSIVGTVNGKNFSVTFDHSSKGYTLAFGFNKEGCAKQPERTAVGMVARKGLMKRRKNDVSTKPKEDRKCQYSA